MARKDDDFADELDNHLDLLTAEYTRRGMAPRPPQLSCATPRSAVVRR